MDYDEKVVIVMALDSSLMSEDIKVSSVVSCHELCVDLGLRMVYFCFMKKKICINQMPL